MTTELQTDTAVLLKITIEQQETIQKLTQHITELQNRLDKLLHILYGTKSEKQKQQEKRDEKTVSQKNARTKLKGQEDQDPSHGRRGLPVERKSARSEQATRVLVSCLGLALYVLHYSVISGPSHLLSPPWWCTFESGWWYCIAILKVSIIVNKFFKIKTSINAFFKI